MPAGWQYDIVVTGRVGPRVLAALPGFEILGCDSDRTRLRGWVRDQAALQGLVRSLGDLGVAIEGLHRIDPPN